MFKIETHLHTPVISPCARVNVPELVRRYTEAGYAGVVVTDHYQLNVFQFDTPSDKLQDFLEGYRQFKQEADRVGLMTYYGAELCFTENSNHYLLYGFSDELLADPKKICTMGIAAFSELARKDGALLIQAHPFRRGCVPVAPHLVDGIEAINRHDIHANHNDLAWELAQRYGMLKTSGDDFHDPEDRCIAGIGVDALPKDSMELAKLIRSGNFALLNESQTPPQP